MSWADLHPTGVSLSIMAASPIAVLACEGRVSASAS